VHPPHPAPTVVKQFRCNPNDRNKHDERTCEPAAIRPREPREFCQLIQFGARALKVQCAACLGIIHKLTEPFKKSIRFCVSVRSSVLRSVKAGAPELKNSPGFGEHMAGAIVQSEIGRLDCDMFKWGTVSSHGHAKIY